MSITLNESLNKIMTPSAVATERYVEEMAKEILMRNQLIVSRYTPICVLILSELRSSNIFFCRRKRKHCCVECSPDRPQNHSINHYEYTKNNFEFCLKFNPNNDHLRNKQKEIDLKIKEGKPTIPSTIKEEIKTNIFLRYDDLDVKDTLNLKNASDLEIFTKLRDLKDNF